MGIACRATRYGQTERSSHRAWAIATASAMPTTIAIVSPMSVTLAVTHRPERRSARFEPTKNDSSMTRCGSVMRNPGLSKTCSRIQ